VVLDYVDQHAGEDVPVLWGAVDFLHVRLLLGHELEELGVDLAVGRIRGELLDAGQVRLHDIVAQILEEVLDGLIVQIERFAVDHRPLRELFNRYLGEWHLAYHLLYGALDGSARFNDAQVALHLVCHENHRLFADIMCYRIVLRQP